MIYVKYLTKIIDDIITNENSTYVIFFAWLKIETYESLIN